MQSCAHIVFTRHAFFQMHRFLHAIYTSVPSVACPMRVWMYSASIDSLFLQAS